MRIGIMTFHWGANYGAVLQAYSLVRYLQKNYDADVEIIDYYPENLALTYKNAMRIKRPGALFRKIKEIRKNKIIAPFRDKLPLSKRYRTNEELISSPLEYDIVIAGSDQIWNPYFLLSGEKKITPAYYLNFCDAGIKKIAISASFGCRELPSECNEIVVPLLKQFYGISVREGSGAEILSSLGFDSVPVTADPSALMSKEMYMELCTPDCIIKPGSVSKFILRKQTSDTNKLINACAKAHSKNGAIDIDFMSLPNWLAAIRDSKIVITNSFHCVMMCLKLHTPFAVVLETGINKGMNDRFTTLLDEFQLSDRIIRDVQDINKLSASIDFDKVDEAMESYSYTLRSYIERTIFK